ncbi:MAG: type II toxin-antitoxin system ParD family antitoxin [Alphaproteobacteria bacterium]|nr:type II toxin-antitoxin system ParD family antitoxin [Alphaproteobacteria bacterium]
MATMNVSLPDPMKEWVEAQAATGRYANASDYVRDLIRKDQERAAKIASMQDLIDEGLASGEAKGFSVDGFLGAMREKHGVKQT